MLKASNSQGGPVTKGSLFTNAGRVVGLGYCGRFEGLATFGTTVGLVPVLGMTDPKPGFVVPFKLDGGGVMLDVGGGITGCGEPPTGGVLEPNGELLNGRTGAMFASW